MSVLYPLCNVSFIVHPASCAVFCLSIVCYLVWYVYSCTLYLTVVPLPPGKTPFAVKLNNNNINISFGRHRGLVVRVLGYRSRGPGSIPGTTRFSEKY
jgi:hypothetical protein